jgi:hypothetical protein
LLSPSTFLLSFPLSFSFSFCLIFSVPSFHSTACGSRCWDCFREATEDPEPCHQSTVGHTRHHPIGKLRALWRPISAHAFSCTNAAL